MSFCLGIASYYMSKYKERYMHSKKKRELIQLKSCPFCVSTQIEKGKLEGMPGYVDFVHPLRGLDRIEGQGNRCSCVLESSW
jgi:hypothetical protein